MSAFALYIDNNRFKEIFDSNDPNAIAAYAFIGAAKIPTEHPPIYIGTSYNCDPTQIPEEVKEVIALQNTTALMRLSLAELTSIGVKNPGQLDQITHVDLVKIAHHRQRLAS